MRREIYESYGNFYAKLTKSSFLNLYEELDKNLFYISTDKKWSLIQVPKFSSIEEFVKILNEFSYYNCSEETGVTVSFWIDISDLPLSKFNRFKHEYLRTMNVNYTTLVKQYLISTKGVTQ